MPSEGSAHAPQEVPRTSRLAGPAGGMGRLRKSAVMLGLAAVAWAALIAIVWGLVLIL